MRTLLDDPADTEARPYATLKHTGSEGTRHGTRPYPCSAMSVRMFGTLCTAIACVGTGVIGFIATQTPLRDHSSTPTVPTMIVSDADAPEPTNDVSENMHATDETASSTFGTIATFDQKALKERYGALTVSDTPFIVVDLQSASLRLMKGAATIASYRVIDDELEHSSRWHTPSGIFSIQDKERDRFSSLERRQHPWSMRFHGHFSIHGSPQHSHGTSSASSKPGGCLPLSADDARDLFDRVRVGTPVLVFDGEDTLDHVTYTRTRPMEPYSFEARAHLAIDLESATILDSAHTTEQFPIASITKLMTALVALEHHDLNEMVTVPESATVYTSKPRYTAGESVRAYDLLYPLLSESSNEAANTIAHAFDRTHFVQLMNDTARSIGMDHTTFVDPSGSGAGNTSTAEDLAILARYLTRYRAHIFDITANRSHGEIYYGTSSHSKLANFNHFVSDTRFVGGKTGRTTAALETMLAVFSEELGDKKRTIAYIVLGTEDVGSAIREIRDRVVRSCKVHVTTEIERS